MDGQSVLVIFLLFFVRLLVPLIILLALGYLYERWSARQPEHPKATPPTDRRGTKLPNPAVADW